MSSPADRIGNALEEAKHTVSLLYHFALEHSANPLGSDESDAAENLDLTYTSIDALVRETLEATAALVEPVSHPEGGGVDTGRIWTFSTLRRVHTAILALRDEVLGRDSK